MENKEFDLDRASLLINHIHRLIFMTEVALPQSHPSIEYLEKTDRALTLLYSIDLIASQLGDMVNTAIDAEFSKQREAPQ